MREDEADMARTALITGATGGLGGAVVDRFAREGWSVLGVDKRPSEDRENVRFVEADLCDEEIVVAVPPDRDEQPAEVGPGDHR